MYEIRPLNQILLPLPKTLYPEFPTPETESPILLPLPPKTLVFPTPIVKSEPTPEKEKGETGITHILIFTGVVGIVILEMLKRK